MTRENWSGRMARRVSAVGASLLMGVTGMVVLAPTSPAAETGQTTGTAVPAVAVSVEEHHSCALTASGGVRCWGLNDFGQLGDGTATARLSPVDVDGLTTGVTQVSTGARTTCAVTTVGGVKCWGIGVNGELGNGTLYSSSFVPVDVVGLPDEVTSVSVGYASACAVTVTGAVTCWGSGSRGALGNGRTTDSATPVGVVGLDSGATAVATGYLGACAATVAGVSCWGTNALGELGNGSAARSSATPVPVVGLGADVTSIDAGRASRCAATSTGSVSCWGYNGSGNLGVGTLQRVVPTPRLVRGLRGVSAVTAGPFTTCGTQAHRTLCWGDNGWGALGDGTNTPRTSPVAVVGLPGAARSVATSYDHTCVVTAAGRVLCWGQGGYLGNGTGRSSLTPVGVKGFGP